MTSGLVAECLDVLSALASLNKFTLAWVPRHWGICGNEGPNKLARQASAMPLLGPELALGIPKFSVRQAIKNWTEMEHLRAWIDLPGIRHGKLFIDRACTKRADKLLKLGRHQLKMATAIYTGHVPVRGHLFTILPVSWGSKLQIFWDGDRNSAAHYLLLQGIGSSAL